MKIKILAIALCAIILFSSGFTVPKAEAYWGIADFNILDAPSYITRFATWISSNGSWLGDIYDRALTIIKEQMVVLNKIAALLVLQKATALIIGSNGDSSIIRDFNNYLYTSPQQTAMTRMNSFFNTVSQGRLSSLNYSPINEGIGPTYDQYLAGQAKQAINGQVFTSTLQNSVNKPSQMFDGGNMKGIMTYMQCANNVACYTLATTEQYNIEFSKAQTVAKNENVNVFIPKKLNFRVLQPAAIAENSLSQLDQYGTQLTMTADNNGGYSAVTQVWEGVAISAAARLTNYGISDKSAQDNIRKNNDQYPFSLGYNSNSGIILKK